MVDHLMAKGYSISNTPNEKLSDEMYNALMKEFASEKILKQKVEQIKEAKQEKRLQQEESHEQDDEEFVSAEQLRKGYLEGRKDAAGIKTETVAEKGAEVTKDEGDSRYPGLKVKGKIDLDALSGRKPKPQEEPQQKPVVEPIVQAKVEEPKVEVKPVVVETPKVEEPKVEVKEVQETKPVVETPKVEEPKVEVVPVVETPKVEEPKVETVPVVETPKVEAPVVVEKSEPVVAETTSEPESAEIEHITAADHSPKLAGLNIKGKIDLDALS